LKRPKKELISASNAYEVGKQQNGGSRGSVSQQRPFAASPLHGCVRRLTFLAMGSSISATILLSSFLMALAATPVVADLKSM
jgi:glucosamine 6-phosphate synthetase-like amidotransferase/phosphosugar isomerase protein